MRFPEEKQGEAFVEAWTRTRSGGNDSIIGDLDDYNYR